MTEPLSLSLGQQFELERMNRAIDSTADLQTLQGLAKQLLQAWHSQKAATQWVMRQQLGGSTGVPPDLSPALAQQWGLES
jgi:hypothetical protein